VPTPATSLIDEARLAAQGTARVIAGRPDAPLYFGEGLPALFGSLLALVVAIAFSLAITTAQIAITGATPLVSSFETVATTAIIFLGQVGGTYAAFRTLKRADRFVPYLVADNWTSFYLSIATAVLGAFGLDAGIILLAVALVTLVAKVNIARLIAELRLGGIAILIIAQICGGAAALLVVGLLFGPVPV